MANVNDSKRESYGESSGETGEQVIILEWGGGGGVGWSGDVAWPASAVDGHFAQFDTATGKLLKDGGYSPASFAAALGADDNYVTDAQLVIIANTSGTNTGDNATNSQYSGLAASKADVGQTMYIGTTAVAINRASAALVLTGITSIDGNAATATTATHLAGGSGGTIPYQSAAGTTVQLANGTAGQVLTSAGTTLAPTWSTVSGFSWGSSITGTTGTGITVIPGTGSWKWILIDTWAGTQFWNLFEVKCPWVTFSASRMVAIKNTGSLFTDKQILEVSHIKTGTESGQCSWSMIDLYTQRNLNFGATDNYNNVRIARLNTHSTSWVNSSAWALLYLLSTTTANVTDTSNLLLMSPCATWTWSATSLSLPNTSSAKTNGIYYTVIENTQSAAQTVYKINLGTSAQAHNGIQIIGTNASATAVAFNANMGTGWTGKLFRWAVNSVEKFVVNKDGLITTGYQNYPEGFLINGKIVTSVATNNLTVAIKTLAGTDPSATDPIYCRIGGVVRSITSALSIILNAWINWNNMWSSELATNEVDNFTYLWYSTSESKVQMWFSRIPYWTLISDFNNVSDTNEKSFARSWAFNTTDPVVNIWRFAATLSSGPGYTWSVPTFTPSNLIQRPIYETRELDFVSQFSGSGSMTVSCTPSVQKYILEWSKCFYKIEQTAITTGWTASTNIYASTPFASKRLTSWAWQIRNGGYMGTSIIHQQWDSCASIWSSNSLWNWGLWTDREVFFSMIEII